jgi:asparagine synthase (glutamine-hydrolysing)
MCGIAGIINLSNRVSKIEKKDISILKKMLFSRGPDASGVWHSQKKNIILTTQRLATQDKRPIANQPCWSSDKKIVAILNGEIYNHRELKNKLELKGYIFLTNNDTEVIANAYHCWGDNFLKKIQGQFALTVYNKLKKEGIIARDEHGISPLFYLKREDKLYFSSTPDSLFSQSKESLLINPQAVSDFLVADYVSEGNTFFKNIKYLKPGNFIKFNTEKNASIPKNYILSKISIKKDRKEIKNENDYVEEIYESLKEGVKTRLKGDKEVGIFLSSGLDSSLILALFRKLYPEKNIKTFTASFRDQKNSELIGEHDNALKISNFFNANNKIVPIDSNELLKSIGSYSQPSASIMEFINQSLSKESKKNGIEAVLTGEGADELFLGYDHNLALISHFKKQFNFLNKKFKFRSNYGKKNNSKLKIEDVFLGGGADIDLDNNRNSIFGKEVLSSKSFKDIIVKFINNFDLKNPEDADKISFLIDFSLKVPELFLRRAEGPTMNEGVELRFPFLQTNLKELAYSIPLNIKIGKKIETKYLLRKVAEKLIPKDLRFAKLPIGIPALKKEYFKNSGQNFKKPAFKDFFYNNYSMMSEIILDGKYRKLNLFNEDFLEKTIKKQSDSSNCFFDKSLWKIWNIARWYERLA